MKKRAARTCNSFAMILATGLFAAATVFAQPSIESALNAASYTPAALPNGGLAQGSMFVLFGRNLGPTAIVQVSQFPLPRALAGTSVRVTVGSTPVQGIMVYTLATQVAAILPSDTPTGAGSVVVTFNNQTSAPFAIRVVRASFGIFALNQAGSGPGVFTDPDFVPNTLVRAATPSSVWIIWGTGGGPVSGNENEKPLPGDQTWNVVVFVGGRRANVIYRGRSGCCAGLDQIVFEVPDGVAGCYVPVVVVVEGVPSNFVTMSIASEGSTCSDPGGLSPADLSRLQSSGALRIGSVAMSRTTLRVDAGAAGGLDIRTDFGSAGFSRYDAARFFASQSLFSLSGTGVCLVYTFRGLQAAQADVIRPDPLEAGPVLNLAGPRGTRQLPRVSPGLYSAQLGGGGVPGFPGSTQPNFIERGNYTVNNGNGGADVGRFDAALEIPDPVTWSNQAGISVVPRSQPLLVTWSGGDPREMVLINGSSVLSSGQAGAGFLCRERAAAGRFSVPPEILLSLPPSEVVEGIPTGVLMVGSSADPVRFNATGLDLGLFSYSVLSLKNVGYDPAPPLPASGFRLSSSAFQENATIPRLYSCQGSNLSPPLEWSGPPTGAQSFALIMDDPDAPGGTFTHWLLWDIPASTRVLPQGFQVGQTGVSGIGEGGPGYFGPCPPTGPAHRYVFKLFAVGVPSLGLAAGAGREAVERALTGRTLGEARYTGLYARQ